MSEELPELTDQQLKFVQGIQAGKSASDAYRMAYNCDSMLDKTVWAEASRLKSNHKVTAWLRHVKQEQLTATKYSLDDHIKELEHLAQVAEEKGQIGPAVSAIEKKGRALGLYVERSEDVTQGNDQDLLKGIEALLGPDIAREAARRLGYEIQEDTEH